MNFDGIPRVFDPGLGSCCLSGSEWQSWVAVNVMTLGLGIRLRGLKARWDFSPGSKTLGERVIETMAL